MKIHFALKDPSMKYPRAANWLLDVGMVLFIASCVASFGVVVGFLSDDIWFPMVGRFFSFGLLSILLSKMVARFRRDGTPSN